MQRLFPLYSEIDVFYDENNPKLSYVLRYCDRRFWFWFMLVVAIIILVIDIGIIFIL